MKEDAVAMSTPEKCGSLLSTDAPEKVMSPAHAFLVLVCLPGLQVLWCQGLSLAVGSHNDYCGVPFASAGLFCDVNERNPILSARY